ncbi:MAG: hypothetical protein NTY38_22365 [Acidobacteria bacterium]|nr:hypothetical protein [Acidobacteriota bacterium]
MRVALLANRLSRRAFLATLPVPLISQDPAQPEVVPAPKPNSRKGQTLPTDARKYLDAATEFTVYRLTDSSYRSLLPLQSCRAISHRGSFLLYSSDRTGSLQVFGLDLKSGESRPWTDVAGLDPASVTLTPDDRSMLLFDGPALIQIHLGSLRERPIYRLPESSGRGQGFAVSDDGLHICFVEKSAGRYRLQLLRTSRSTVSTAIESADVISMPSPRPRRAGLLYRRGEGELRLVGYDGTQDRALKVADGRVGPALWAADGKFVLYLSIPAERGKASSIRENTPDTNTDKLVAPTSQFSSFARNADGSMFVGASSNQGAPYVLLLLRMTRRELTLCEHRASNPLEPRQAGPLLHERGPLRRRDRGRHVVGRSVSR